MTKINVVSKKNLKTAFLTPKGLAEVKTELDFLTKNKRTEIAEKIHQAREYGDLTENSEYDSAVEEQSLVENRISELENVLKNVRIISDEHKEDFVVLGSTVKIDMDGEIDEFKIVGRVEADPGKKRISNESPLGTALLGAKKGEVVEVATPIVRYKCKVLEIS